MPFVTGERTVQWSPRVRVHYLAILAATAQILPAKAVPALAKEPAPAGVVAAADAGDEAEVSILEPPFSRKPELTRLVC
jgi:hypothetical protein